MNKSNEPVEKLKAMFPVLESEQKNRSLRDLTDRLVDEATEHCKYLALVKKK